MKGVVLEDEGGKEGWVVPLLTWQHLQEREREEREGEREREREGERGKERKREGEGGERERGSENIIPPHVGSIKCVLNYPFTLHHT